MRFVIFLLITCTFEIFRLDQSTLQGLGEICGGCSPQRRKNRGLVLGGACLQTETMGESHSEIAACWGRLRAVQLDRIWQRWTSC